MGGAPTTCFTPGAIYSTTIENGSDISLSIKLPRPLLAKMNERELVAFEERLHTALLGPIEWLYGARWSTQLAGEFIDGRHLPDDYGALFEAD